MDVLDDLIIFLYKMGLETKQINNTQFINIILDYLINRNIPIETYAKYKNILKKLNKHNEWQLYKNSNITSEEDFYDLYKIHKYINGFSTNLFWKALSLNKTLPISVVKKLPEKCWDIYAIKLKHINDVIILPSTDEKISNMIKFARNIHLCANITIDDILQYGELPWDWAHISYKENLTIQDVFKYKKMPWWNWSAISLYDTVTMQIVLNNPSMPWDWFHLSLNKNITLIDILDNRQLPWYWSAVCCRFMAKLINNPHIMTDKILYDKILNAEKSMELIISSQLLNNNVLKSLFKNKIFDIDTIILYCHFKWPWNTIIEYYNLHINKFNEYFRYVYNIYKSSNKPLPELDRKLILTKCKFTTNDFYCAYDWVQTINYYKHSFYVYLNIEDIKYLMTNNTVQFRDIILCDRIKKEHKQYFCIPTNTNKIKKENLINLIIYNQYITFNDLENIYKTCVLEYESEDICSKIQTWYTTGIYDMLYNDTIVNIFMNYISKRDYTQQIKKKELITKCLAIQKRTANNLLQ